MENNGYQNQPMAQPVAPVQPMQVAPAPKKDSKTGLYVIIAVLGVAAVGLAIALIIVLMGSGSKPNDEAASKTEEQEESSSEVSLVKERDEERRTRLNHFVIAAQDYQTNNRGQTPWADGETSEKFVQRYIDSKCVKITDDVYKTMGSVEEKYKCQDGAAEWLDPDGNTYGFKVIKNIEDNLADNGTNDVSIRGYLGKWPNGYKIVVVLNSSCSDESGVVTWHNAPRQYSLSMRLEGGDIACVDNH